MTTVEAPERRRAFCARLKGEREGRGTSLAAIAETTKVKASLLEAFERGDLSRWPKGIYRRAFFREYVATIGLPPEPYVGEFVDLFSDGESPRELVPPPNPGVVAPGVVTADVAVPGINPAGGALRLTFAPEMRAASAFALGSRRFMARLTVRGNRAIAAAADIGAVLTLALVASALVGWGFWSSTGVIACLYYSASTAWLGRSAAAAFLGRRARASTIQTSTIRVPLAGDVPATIVAARRHLLRHPALRNIIGHGLRSRSVLREQLDRVSGAIAFSGTGQRRRELARLRRRRVDAATRSEVDDISAIT
jgi:hypothetical protein